jgi:glycerate kinase
MKIVIAPDKFKGSLPATQVAAAIAAGLRAALGPGEAELVTTRWPTAARGRWTRPSRPDSTGCR